MKKNQETTHPTPPQAGDSVDPATGTAAPADAGQPPVADPAPAAGPVAAEPGIKMPRSPRKKGGQTAKPARRRPAVPITVVNAADREALVALGVPVSQALRGTVADVRKSTAEIGTVAERTTLPRAADRAGAPVADQAVLSRIQVLALGDHPEVTERTQVSPTTLAVGVRKKDVLSRGKRLTVAGQNLAADGRLFIGAKFTFLFDIVLDVYRQLLQGTPDERARAVTVFGKVDSIRFRLLKKLQDGQASGKDKKAQLSINVAEQQDETAFLHALQLIDQGVTPDADTLVRANRHANRLQQEYGLGLERRGDSRA